MWVSSKGDEFNTKADAFEFINKVDIGVDAISIHRDGIKHYTKNFIGIYCHEFSTYIKGLLPVERYETI